VLALVVSPVRAAAGSPDEAAGRRLRARVWSPLAEHLRGAKVVLLAPDGLLCGLPFAALPGATRGTYLLEEVALSYLTGGRQLLGLPGAGRRNGGLLAVGALDYGKASGRVLLPTGGEAPAWAPLPGTRLEVERLARSFRRAFPKERAPRLLAGAAADRPRQLRELNAGGGRRWRYLHLATHGFFSPPPPAPSTPDRRELLLRRSPLLLSGLVLSGANGEAGKGLWTAEEVAGADLRGCELCVLSACDTGLGRIDPGEGVLGLQSAFAAAGAPSLVCSLWSVHDAATSVLMEEFYARLWGKKRVTRLEALRSAQLVVLKNPGKVRARARELEVELRKRGVPEELWRGPKGRLPRPLPGDGKVEKPPKRSPVAWWAGFVLSGDWR
jgi:CHAT domain-containing protein